MKTVEVIAPAGAVIYPPATLRLSRDQHAARAGRLGVRHRTGLCEVLRPVEFKRGESFGIAKSERLGADFFQEVQKREAPEAE